MNTRIIGKALENIATTYLEKQDHLILNKNYFCKYGEIDIISTKNETLYFIEVKGSQKKSMELHYKINTKKKERIFNTAMNYMEKHNKWDFQVVFSALLVNQYNIEYYENIISENINSYENKWLNFKK